MKRLVIIVTVLNWTPVLGQLKNYITENENWYNGQALLADGTTLKGQFNYNFITDVLSYKSQKKSTPYSARTVRKFILKDIKTGLEKEYYSIPFSDESTKRKRLTFFEVIYQKENIAILSRHRYHYKERAIQDPNPYGVHASLGTRTKEQVMEFIYLADDEGNIIEYAKIKKDKYKDVQFDSGFFKREEEPEESYAESKTNRTSEMKYKVTNSHAISVLTKSLYPEIKKYIKRQNIDLQKIDELKVLFDYYITIN